MPGAAGSRPPESGGRPAGLSDRWTVPGVCIFLAVATWLVFGQTVHYGFINFDDNLYVYENPAVSGGLTLKGIAAMFTHVECNFYHPLTMISLMLNDQLDGLQPGGYHLANVLLHTLSAILLFLVLRGMTGMTWRSAFVAAVFAIHPLHVESVAWVAERKDVLSGLFFMLTLWAYARYVRDTRSTVRYLEVVVVFALGLLCKPSLVTLPFVLLLLDYWPLGRLGGGAAAGGKGEGQRGSLWVLAHLIMEKVPLLVLSAAASVVAAIAEGEAIQSLGGLSFLARMSNPIISYVTYLRQMIYPADLAPFYPFPARDVFGWEIVLALVLLVGISGVAIGGWRKRPYMLVGWLWYVGMLVPMIGIMQVGGFAHADRFSYLPMIGLSVALTWAVADLCAGWRHRRVLLGGCATVILVALILCARTQVSYWRDSESLWTHTLACTSDNAIAHNNLGHALFQKGNVDEAIVHYQKALQIEPDYAYAYNNLGLAFFHLGRVDEAIADSQKALAINPNYAEAYFNLGNDLWQEGRTNEAITNYQKVLEINPNDARAQYNLGNALLQEGQFDEAIIHFRKSLENDPSHAETYFNLGNAFLQKGQFDEAITHYRRALEINPNNAETYNNLGNALMQGGRLAGTIQLERVNTVWRACGDETKSSSRTSTGGGPNGAPAN